MQNNAFTYIDLFSGIGGFKIGLDDNGGKSMGFSEIDKWAIETYKNNFSEPLDLDLGDVTKITNLPYVDVVTGGVPCQSWSVAGKKRGFDDPRGKLWHDAIRTVEMVQPKVFIFENVKGLMDPRNKANLDLILEHFDRVGYIVHTKLLNSYDFNVPQNRSRIYIVGFRKDLKKYSDVFEYPMPKKSHKQLSDFVDVKHKKIDKVKYNPKDIHGDYIPKSRNAFQFEDELNDFFIFCDTRNGHTTVHSWDIYKTTKREKLICMTILKNRRKKIYGLYDGNPLSVEQLQTLIPDIKKPELDKLVDKRILKIRDENKYELLNSKNSAGIDNVYRVFLPNSKIFSTLTATGTKDYIATDYVECDDPKEYKQAFIDQIFKTKKFREITPEEAARIQGFPESFKPHTKDKHAHKQFGNAVSPPVVAALAKEIVSTGVFDNSNKVLKIKKPQTISELKKQLSLV